MLNSIFVVSLACLGSIYHPQCVLCACMEPSYPNNSDDLFWTKILHLQVAPVINGTNGSK